MHEMTKNGRVQILRILRNSIIHLVRQNKGASLARLGFWAASPFTSFFFVRQIVDELQPNNPLGNRANLPSISVVIALARKDFESVGLAAQGVLSSSRNPIQSITLVVPRADRSEAIQRFSGVQIISEEELLPTVILDALSRHHPPGRRGWVLQQLIGMYFAREASAAATLVLDSDTVLINELAFLAPDGQQLLQLSHESENCYEEHAERIWGPRRRHRGLSYVTHYQLMQKDVLKAMFPDDSVFESWILSADVSRNSPVADYHSYGRYLVDHFPARFVLGRWGNKSLPWKAEYGADYDATASKWRSLFPGYFSVSLHHYLSKKN